MDVDTDGYLVHREEWTEALAIQLAADEGLLLTPAHWELIAVVREFYSCFEISPAMRPLTKRVREALGDDKASSIYLLGLFPGNPAKRLARIAGLPRPTNCL